jgi:hypothetical protein
MDGGGSVCDQRVESRPRSAATRQEYRHDAGVHETSRHRGAGRRVAFGVLTQLAAIGLILVMLGSIYKKSVVWHTGFWGKQAQGWHYDLVLILLNLVIACTDGGRFVLSK